MKRFLITLGLAGLCFGAPAVMAHEHEHPAPLTGKAPSSKSLYWLASKWPTHRQSPIELKRLRGYPVVLAMLYTSCSSVCPLILQDVKQIEKELSATEKAKTRFIIVSFDPTKDTPAVLAAYARKNNVDLANWHFLSGTPGQVSELAALLGVRYQKTAQGEFTHSNQITLLNREGEVVYQRPDLQSELSVFVSHLKHVIAGHHH